MPPSEEQKAKSFLFFVFPFSFIFLSFSLIVFYLMALLRSGLIEIAKLYVLEGIYFHTKIVVL